MPALRNIHKKKMISTRLPPYLLHWMDRQQESRAILIETALNSYYQIPVHLSDDSQCPACGAGTIEQLENLYICSNCDSNIEG